MSTDLASEGPEPDHRDPAQVERDLNSDAVTVNKQGEKPPYKK